MHVCEQWTFSSASSLWSLFAPPKPDDDIWPNRSLKWTRHQAPIPDRIPHSIVVYLGTTIVRGYVRLHEQSWSPSLHCSLQSLNESRLFSQMSIEFWSVRILICVLLLLARDWQARTALSQRARDRFEVEEVVSSCQDIYDQDAISRCNSPFIQADYRHTVSESSALFRWECSPRDDNTVTDIMLNILSTPTFWSGLSLTLRNRIDVSSLNIFRLKDTCTIYNTRYLLLTFSEPLRAPWVLDSADRKSLSKDSQLWLISIELL